jgi:sugar-specific transcriptional regulator TrmB
MSRAVAWEQVLDQIEASLTQTIAAVPEPPPLPPAEPPADWEAAWQSSVRELQERLQRLEAAARKAENNANALDAVLKSNAAALQRWLDAAAEVRQRLVNCTTGAV